MESVHQEMSDILPQDLCDQVFLIPINSSRSGSNVLEDCDPDTTVAEYVVHYRERKALPAMDKVLTERTKQKLRTIYSEDYAMIAQAVACSESGEAQPIPLEETQSSSLRRQVQASNYLLQFGVSEATFEVLRSLRASDGGRLFCVVSPDDLLDTFCRRIDLEHLWNWLVLVPAAVTDWPYCSDSDVQWFSEAVFEALPRFDFVIVDGPNRQKQPYSVYPALPSIIDQLNPGSEVWMLNADSSGNRTVEQWCGDFAVSSEPAADGRILRIRV